MIDPNNVINYNRNIPELQEFLLFCILAAGKNSFIQAQKLDDFLKPARDTNITPFELIRFYSSNGVLEYFMKEHGLGQYGRLLKTFNQILDLDLETCSVQDLEGVFGIGSKTARFFITMSREGVRHAILDTHILRWMREELGVETPHTTPPPKKYAELETLFLKECDARDMIPAEFDLSIWKQRARQPKA